MEADTQRQKCEGNADKEGIQLVVWPNLFKFQSGQLYESLELEITGKHAGNWFKLSAYAISPDDLIAKLETKAPIWEVLK